MSTNNWLMFIFVLLLMCFFMLGEINSEIKNQSITESEKTVQKLEKEQKSASRELAVIDANLQKEKLSSQSFSRVPIEEKASWIIVKLNSYHPLASLGVYSLILLAFAFIVKRLCGER